MKRCKLFAGVLALAGLSAPAALAEQLIWGFQAEQVEYRVGENGNVFVFDFDALVGRDEWKVVWRSEGEFSFEENAWETMENQLRLHVPISFFFDAVAGVRLDTPEAGTRVHGVLGIRGLAPQWFEIDAEFAISEHPSFRFEAEYEGLITNRIIVTPSIELNVPFTDDEKMGQGAWGPTMELGARLSYDLVDRAISPYIGVSWERSFGKTASMARSEGGDAGEVFFVVGARLMF